jgi:hypothetical protein
MRLPLIILMSLSLTACASLWPFGAPEKTGNCLDDDSCENANPFEEQLIGGVWYCYGTDRDNWDCGQEEVPGKIAVIRDEAVKESISLETEPVSDDTFSPEPAEPDSPSASITEPAEPVADDADMAHGDLSAWPDDSFAIQLIALQTVDEVMQFAARYDIAAPIYARIRSQDSDWFVVLLTVSDDRDTAQRIASEWEAEHNPSSKPWVRPLGPLKLAIQSAISDG